MKSIVHLALGTIACLSLLGCGGSASLGSNAKMRVFLTRTDNTQVMSNFEIYLTPNAQTTLDTTQPASFASTTNQPGWIDDYSSSRSTNALELDFTTRSTQVPYFLWVKVPNTGAAYETVGLRIEVNGGSGTTYAYDLSVNTTQRLTSVRINRESATY